MSIRKTTYVILVIIAVVALGIVLTAGDQDTEPADDGNQQSTTTATTTADHFTDHSDPLAGTSTDYYPQEEDVNGYLSLPETASADEPAPAVILVHEWWGLNEDIKQMADDFADQGYVALAVDMYGQPPTASSSVAQTRSGQVRSNIDAAMANLDAAKTYLEDRDDVDRQRIGSVGWCFGGDWAYRLAAENMGLEGSVMYYGQFDPQDDFNSMRASILGHFGEEDSIVDVSNAREFKANLEQADEESAVYIYPNVGHGFANYRAGENLEYDRESAERAWNRTLEFLSRELDYPQQGK
jgi:carboxymethylenebutenolidase